MADLSLATLADLDAYAKKTDLPQDTGWVDLALAEGVTGFAKYRVVAGLCTYRVSVTMPGGLASPLAAFLPAPARPKTILRLPAYGFTNGVTVNSSGNHSLSPVPPAGQAVSFELVYRVD